MTLTDIDPRHDFMDLTKLPTTRTRRALLQEALTYTSKDYLGGDLTEGWRVIVRHTLGLPVEPMHITREHFTTEGYQRALDAYGEILQLGWSYLSKGIPNDKEAEVCSISFSALTYAVRQLDLTETERIQTHVDALVASLTHYLVHTPGGIGAATTDLLVLMKEKGD